MEEIIAHIVQPISWIDVIISVCSLLISVIAGIISINTYRSQKEHNKNSVRPILNIVLGDYEDDLYVRVENNGVGPAIVSSIHCTCSYFDELLSANSLVELIPYKATVQGERSGSTADIHSFTDFVEDNYRKNYSSRRPYHTLANSGTKKSAIISFSQFVEQMLC